MSELQVGDVKLSYDVRGEGPPVVNINGAGGSVEFWWQLGLGQKILDAGFQLITFDNRGIPPSDVPPPPYTVNQMAQDTIGLLEHINKGPYTLIGSSLGGMIAQTVALQRSDLVNAVAFIGGCGNMTTYSALIEQGFADLLENDNPLKSIYTALMLPLLISPNQITDKTAIDSLTGFISAIFPTQPKGFIGQMHADIGWSKEDHLEELSQLDMPALAIASEFDIIFPPVFVKEAVSKMLKGEYLEISGSGHVSMKPEHSNQVMSAIMEFLSKYALTGSSR